MFSEGLLGKRNIRGSFHPPSVNLSNQFPQFPLSPLPSPPFSVHITHRHISIALTLATTYTTTSRNRNDYPASSHELPLPSSPSPVSTHPAPHKKHPHPHHLHRPLHPKPHTWDQFGAFLSSITMCDTHSEFLDLPCGKFYFHLQVVWAGSIVMKYPVWCDLSKSFEIADPLQS